MLSFMRVALAVVSLHGSRTVTKTHICLKVETPVAQEAVPCCSGRKGSAAHTLSSAGDEVCDGNYIWISQSVCLQVGMGCLLILISRDRIPCVVLRSICGIR